MIKSSPNSIKLSNEERIIIDMMRCFPTSEKMLIKICENFPHLSLIEEPLRRVLALFRRTDPNLVELYPAEELSVSIFELQILYAIAGVRADDPEVVHNLLSQWLPRGTLATGLALIANIARILDDIGMPAFSATHLRSQIKSLALYRLKKQGYAILDKKPAKNTLVHPTSRTLH